MTVTESKYGSESDRLRGPNNLSESTCRTGPCKENESMKATVLSTGNEPKATREPYVESDRIRIQQKGRIMRKARNLWSVNSLFTLVTALGLMLAFPVAAAAEGGDPECRTVTTELVDRPDSAVGGDTWAFDDLTRTVMVCEISDEGDGLSFYEAQLRDTGTFETVGGTTTPAGDPGPLPAGITGEIDGGVRFEIIAEAGFGSFDASDVDGKTFSGEDPRGTSDWVLPMFEEEAEQKGKVYATTWSWTYTTCSEQHIQSAENLGGYSGDITGKECPAPTPTPTVTATAEPTPTETSEPTSEPTPEPTDDVTPAASQETLPETGGSSVVWLVVLGVALVLFGAGAVVLRRT